MSSGSLGGGSMSNSGDQRLDEQRLVGRRLDDQQFGEQRLGEQQFGEQRLRRRVCGAGYASPERLN
jgi:hypothetical protein